MKRTLLSLLLLLAITASTSASFDGTAKWICAADCPHTPNCWQIFRKSFNLDRRPSDAIAYIAADSKYWLWINGRPVVFEGSLKRGPAPGDCYYDVVEIGKYLKKGKNTIALLSWYFGKPSFSHSSSGKAAIYFEATVGGVCINSGSDWLAETYRAYKDTDAPHPNFRLPESNVCFDARLEKRGWQTADYDDSTMPCARLLASAGEAPFGQMVERPIPLWKEYGLRNYTAVRSSANGDTLYCSLPYNCQMTPYMKIEAPAGKRVQMMTDNYRGGSDINIRAEYITRDGLQEYESYGWINGHEVCYIIPEGVKVFDVKFRETGYDTEFSGSFSCNDAFLNELWKRSARTLYITMRDNYMDCPDRERAQWWGDEVNELGEAFYALSPPSHKLATKGILELINWQRSDGTLFSPVPSNNWNKELPLQMLASVGWYGFYTQYYYSGDSSFIPKIYDGLHRYLHEVWRTDEDGMAIVRHGEWSWGDWGRNVDLEALTNCWYYLALKAEKEFARMLGKSDDEKLCEAMMQKMRSSFDRRFWNGEAYRTPSYKGATDDRTQAMAVLSGLAGEDKYPAIAALLDKEYHASPYMEKYVLEALCVMNRTEQALDRMKHRYKSMLSYDYTTLFEGWGIGKEGFGGGTINHAWSGGPLTILSQKVCGITPTSPGFRTVRIEPRMGYLQRATATIDTSLGKLKVKIDNRKGTPNVKLKIPKGMSVEVVLPDGSCKSYRR